jgi:hypothetical protein
LLASAQSPEDTSDWQFMFNIGAGTTLFTIILTGAIIVKGAASGRNKKDVLVFLIFINIKAPSVILSY